MERFAFPHTSHKISNEQSLHVFYNIYKISFFHNFFELLLMLDVKKYSPEATSKISFDLTLKSIKSVI